MAKQGLSYYQAETDRFQDIRIKRLKKHFGCEGYAVYTYVVNEIFRVEGSYIIFDEDQAFDTAEYWSLDEDQVMKIIEYCAEISLFDTKLWHTRKILTSPQIQQRYSEICRRAKKRIAIPDEITLISDRSAIQTPCFGLPSSDSHLSATSVLFPTKMFFTKIACTLHVFGVNPLVNTKLERAGRSVGRCRTHQLPTRALHRSLICIPNHITRQASVH